jgi:hypothetical protein
MSMPEYGIFESAGLVIGGVCLGVGAGLGDIVAQVVRALAIATSKPASAVRTALPAGLDHQPLAACSEPSTMAAILIPRGGVDRR